MYLLKWCMYCNASNDEIIPLQDQFASTDKYQIPTITASIYSQDIVICQAPWHWL